MVFLTPNIYDVLQCMYSFVANKTVIKFTELLTLSVHFEDYVQACEQVPRMLLNCISDHPMQFVGVLKEVKYIAAVKLLSAQLFFLFCEKKV